MKEELRIRIYDMEVAPPRSAWNRIAAELDASDLGAPYAASLKGAAVEPPPGAWGGIQARLDDAYISTPLKKPVPWIRYAAAAAILAALAWGGSLILNTRSGGGDVKVVKTILPDTQQPGPAKPEPVVNEPAPAVTELAKSEQDRRDDAALEASKQTYAKLNAPRKNKIRNAAGFHFALDETEPIIPAEEMDPAHRYVVLMTPDGNFIRMSKKWGDFICCVAGEEEDPACTTQMEKWRAKMASHSQTASPGNFGDILELLKSLQND